MILKHIKIKNFRQIDSKEFSFKDGINIIYGLNESGKTTLYFAIISALFDDPEKVNKSYLEGLKTWGKNSYPELELTFIYENKEYTISKDFNLKKSKLIGSSNADDCKNFISNALGIQKDLFLKLSCIGQRDISSIQSNFENLQKQILAILSVENLDNSRNVVDVISMLEKKIQDMQLGMYHVSKNVGVLKKIENEIKDLQGRLEKAREEYRNVEGKKSQIIQRDEKLKKIEHEMKALESFISNSNKLKEINEKKIRIDKELKDMELRINRVYELGEQLKRIKATHKEDFLNDIDKSGQELLSLQAEIDLRKKDLDILKDRKKHIEELHITPIRRNPRFVIFISTVLLALTIISSFFGFLIFAALLIDVVFIGLYLNYIYFNKLEKFHNPDEDRIVEIDKEIQMTSDRINSILTSLGISSISELFKQKSILLSNKEELLKGEATIRGLLGEETLDSLEEKQADLFVQRKNLDYEISDDMKSFSTADPVVLRKKQLELSDLEMDKFDIEDEILADNTRISDSFVSEEEIGSMEDRLSSLKEQKIFYDMQFSVMKIALENLNKSKDDVFNQLSEDFNKLGSDWISKITNDKYSSFKISDNKYFSIFDRNKKEFINTQDNLSAGLLDQVYMLARLSILNVVLKGRKSIMLLDDPFVNFDKDRLDIAKDLLKYFSSFNQIFLFTCHDLFKDLV